MKAVDYSGGDVDVSWLSGKPPDIVNRTRSFVDNLHGRSGYSSVQEELARKQSEGKSLEEYEAETMAKLLQAAKRKKMKQSRNT